MNPEANTERLTALPLSFIPGACGDNKQVAAEHEKTRAQDHRGL